MAHSPSQDRIAVTILTGFLGSGKTTLLNRLLGDPRLHDTAVIVNEIGEIGIDHLLVASARENILLLESGCLCCAVLDSLPETMADLYRRRARGEVPDFRRVIIETTGLADPGPIIRAIMRAPLISPFFHLDGLICTIDAVFGLDQLRQEPEASAQAAMADRLFVTKTDIASQSPAPLEARLRALNPLAPILEGATLADPVGALFSAEGGYGQRWQTLADEVHGHVDHDSRIVTASFRITEPVTWSGIAAWTAALRLRLGSDLLRCKGLLNVADVDGPVALHGVQSIFGTTRLAQWPDSDRSSLLLCISRGVDREQLSRSLDLLHLAQGMHPPQSLGDLNF